MDALAEAGMKFQAISVDQNALWRKVSKVGARQQPATRIIYLMLLPAGQHFGSPLEGAAQGEIRILRHGPPPTRGPLPPGWQRTCTHGIEVTHSRGLQIWQCQPPVQNTVDALVSIGQPWRPAILRRPGRSRLWGSDPKDKTRTHFPGNRDSMGRKWRPALIDRNATAISGPLGNATATRSSRPMRHPDGFTSGLRWGLGCACEPSRARSPDSNNPAARCPAPAVD